MLDSPKKERKIWPANISYNIIIIPCILLLTLCKHVESDANNNQPSAKFSDYSGLKPSIILIVPQAFKVPTNQALYDNAQQRTPDQLQQLVVLVNNVKNARDDNLLRKQYPRLALQVRDARNPLTGQLFYEHVFDYFPSDSTGHLVLPIELDQVSPTYLAMPPINSNLEGDRRSALVRPQYLVVSVRPHGLSAGFAGPDTTEFVSSLPVPLEAVPSGDGRRSFTLVQTDKPIYKPTDLVRIRVMVVNENLRPVTGEELRVQIKNPHKIIVEEVRWPNSTQTPAQLADQLFLDHAFEFPPEPMLGSWSVHVLHSDPIANDTTTFEVREYVLPNFEIEFESSKYILPTTNTIEGALVAKYHHGKPVQGKAYFKFGYKESQQAKTRYIARSSIKTIDPATGRVEYKINSDKFKENDWFPGIAGSRLVIEATVTEMSTGQREVAEDTSCVFISMPYKITFDDSIEDFKPALNQQLNIRVLEAQTNRPAAAYTLVKATYYDANNSVITSDGTMTLLENEAFTDSNGRASFNIGPISLATSAIQVAIRAYSAHDGQASLSHDHEIATGHHNLVRHESASGWLVIVNKSANHLSVGDQFVTEVRVKDTLLGSVSRKIYFLVTSKSQIIGAQRLLAEDKMLRLNITESMIPSIRVIVFALAQDSPAGLLSDSMRIDVGQTLDCGLRVAYKSDVPDSSFVNHAHKPNDKGKINIQARAGDVVSVIGVDAALYSLNNRTRLEPTRIVQRIKRLDSGCGFGGGKNNIDVFHNAGLMVFRHAPSQTSDDGDRNRPPIGSFCLSVLQQLRHLEDIQLGYARPVFAAALQLHGRARALESAVAIRQRLASSSVPPSRAKRELDPQELLSRYHEPLARACCKLGTMEDLPQRRNCTVRARIVDRYMRRGGSDSRICFQVYFECCRLIFETESVAFAGAVLGGRSAGPLITEPQISSKRVTLVQSRPEPDASLSLGQLDRIESQTLIRKDFRETWLFELVQVDPQGNGSAVLEVQLPHSITAWSISALALNTRQPMCVMPHPLRITTFQQLFLHVSMPYKVVQGEQIDLAATIYNYSPAQQQVFVYMYGVDDVCSEAEHAGDRSERKRVRLDRYASQTVLFPLIPLKVGTYAIKLVAIASNASSSDVVERLLRVVPRGRPVIDELTFSLDPLNQQRRSKRAIQTGNLVDEIDSSRGVQRSRVKLTPSRDADAIVPQTQECIVSAIGDRMGLTVHTSLLDVENLIRLPHGCGEQVMIYLGPTLYTTRYLSSINKLAGDLRWRALRYVQSGYKRILNFRKPNGAFSAFPRRESSVWLTAFIAKMLCQTERTPFVAEEIHVDRSVVNSALNWLLQIQNNATGTWLEPNPVYHREMLGGVLHENLLTAFVSISLSECAHHAPDLVLERPPPVTSSVEHNLQAVEPDSRRSTAIGASGHQVSNQHQQAEAMDRLKLATQRAEAALLVDKYKASKERNAYVMALTAYALSFSRPHEAVQVLNELMLIAERSRSSNHLHWRSDYPVETAAYALQAIVELAPVLESGNPLKPSWLPGADAVAIGNWLASRRSYTGAFESTQDTVVALEALSKFAQVQASANGHTLLASRNNGADDGTSNDHRPSLVCNVTMSNRTRRSLEFGRDNSLVLQSFKLATFDLIDTTSTAPLLDIVTSGNGLGTMSVRLKYNVFQDEDELCRFNIYSTVEEWQAKIVHSSSEESKKVSTNQDNFGSVIDKPQNTSNASDTIDDDYFKTFDKSMLGELNLIDVNQPDLNQAGRISNSNEQNLTHQIRFRRATSNAAQTEAATASSDSWTSRMVSGLRARLPSWLSGNKPSPTPVANVHSTSITEAPVSHRIRANTSRRSTQGAPGSALITRPTVVSPDAVLNKLSNHFELGSAFGNQSSSLVNNSSSQTPVPSSSGSNRLVLLLRVCVHHMSSRRDSEMAVVEIGVLTGFRPNEADLREIIEDPGTPAMKYELSADRSLVVFYLQYVPFSGPYCMQLRLVRESLVYNLQSGFIRAYEYYSPAHSCATFYTPARQTDMLNTRCDTSGQVCQCAAKSLCPANSKLLELAEINSVNATSARAHLVELACSNRFDLVALVRLKAVRHFQPGAMYRLSVRPHADIRGNLTKLAVASTGPLIMDTSGLDSDPDSELEATDGSSSLSLTVDASCVRNDPLLLHLAHPNQWRRNTGAELMVLFARTDKLERRCHSRSSPMAGMATRRAASWSSSGATTPNSGAESKAAPDLVCTSRLALDKHAMLFDLSYEPRQEPRAAINSLLLWLELRARRDRWACPGAQQPSLASSPLTV